ncbi:MAG: hypothetical protein HRT60_08570 [Dinoroseobacter sp.]|nr:hypothetical protein [Dinoroseobacter sp.]NQZ73112.1 hypothetical protein [Dinoroseobacter sp.]
MRSENLAEEVDALRLEIAKLNDQRFLRSQATWFGLLWYNFLRGLALGLGSVVGATLLVSVLVYMLSSIDFVPVIGEWANEIIAVIEARE